MCSRGYAAVTAAPSSKPAAVALTGSLSDLKDLSEARAQEIWIPSVEAETLRRGVERKGACY